MVNKSFCDRCGREIEEKNLIEQTAYFRVGHKDLVDKHLCHYCLPELEKILFQWLEDYKDDYSQDDAKVENHESEGKT